MSEKEINFEEELNRLKAIVNDIQQKDLSIDESLKLYEEGVAITQDCLDILNSAEGKILVLKKEFDGFVEKPLDEVEE